MKKTVCVLCLVLVAALAIPVSAAKPTIDWAVFEASPMVRVHGTSTVTVGDDFPWHAPSGEPYFYGDHLIYLTMKNDVPVFIYSVTCHASSGSYLLTGAKVSTDHAVYSFDFDSAGGEDSGQAYGIIALGEEGMIMLRDMAASQTAEVAFSGIRLDQADKPEFTETFGYYENQQEHFKAFVDLYDEACKDITADDLARVTTSTVTIEESTK